MSSILRVNMTTKEVTFEPVPRRYKTLGGRGLSSSIVADEVDPTCHPLGPNNKLVIAPGIVTGTSAPTSGRMSVGAKSPLTGGIKEANSGGLAPQKLARLGIKAVVIEGQADAGEWHLLTIDSGGAELVSAADLAGKGLYEMDALLWERYGKVAIIGVGQAGEMKMSQAGISINDIENGPGRYAGRGGLGAVMGSKGLKAIIANDRRTRVVKPKHPTAFKTGSVALTKALRGHPVTGEALPNYGTAVLVNIMNEAGGLPTRNFSSGRFEDAAKVSGEVVNEIATQKKNGKGMVGHICSPGCVIQCSNVFPMTKAEQLVSCMEYESIWALGPNCGIGDINAIAEMVRLCNDIGVDTIEMGATIGVAMEGGLLEFGDAQGAIGLFDDLANGTPVGRILGQGAAFTGRAFGVTRVPTVKGQAMPAYEPRAVKGIGVTYATTTMGADHTAGYTIAPEILGVGGTADPFAVNKAELSRAFQATTAFIDSSGYCLFIAFAILDIPADSRALLTRSMAYLVPSTPVMISIRSESTC